MTGPVKSNGISRRTLVKGAAWSVPVIAVGSAAPAMALTVPVELLAFGSACKLPGNSTPPFDKGYTFGVEVRNNLTVPINVRVTALRQRGVTKTFLGAQVAPNALQTTYGCSTRPDECVLYTPGTTPVQPIGSRDCLLVAAFAEDFTNSGSGLVEIDYEWYNATTGDKLGESTADFDLRGGSWPGGCRPFGVSREQWTCALPGAPTDPIISTVTPDNGCSVSGGPTITITGDNLACTQAVFFGATVAQGSAITNISDTEIQVEVPPSPVDGPVNLGIVTCNGSTPSDGFFTFTYFPC